MGDAIAMARPGTQFSGDGISLSWPRNRDGTPGTREVKEVPPGRRSGRVRQMIVDGAIAEVDLEPTEVTPEFESGRHLYAGGSQEALRRMREPAGPVIRQVFVPVGEVATPELPTSVLEDDAGRRPEQPTFDDDEAPVAAPEPTFEERVASMVEDNTLSTLQGMARDLGIKSSDVKWSSKASLAEALLTREVAAEDDEEAETEPEPEPEPES